MPALNLPVFLEPNRILIPGGTTSANIKAAITAAPADSEIIFTGSCSVSDWGATAFILSKRLWFIGDGCGILTGSTAYTQQLFDVRAPLWVRGMKFNQLGRAFEFNATTGSKLEMVSFEKCEWYDVIRPLYAPDTFSGGETIGVKRLAMNECLFDMANLTLDDPGLGVRASDGEPCIEFFSPFDSMSLTRNKAENVKKAFVRAGFTGDDAEAVNWKKFSAQFNVIKTVRAGQNGSTNNAAGINFFGADAVCEGNQIEDVQCADADEQTGIFVFCETAIMANNRLHNCGGRDGTISIKADTRAGGTTNPPGYRIQIIGNSITYDDSYTASQAAPQRGIWCQQEDVLIQGNIFDRCTHHAIHLIGTVNGKKTIVTDNIITNHRMLDTSDAVVHLNCGDDLIFADNIIECTPQTGIAGRVVRIQPDASGARKNWSFLNNTLKNSGGGSASRGFMIVATSDIQLLEFVGNKFYGVQEGIRFDTGTISDVIAEGNYFHSDVTTPIVHNAVPTRYRYRNNPGRLPQNVTFADLDPSPSVANEDGLYIANYTARTPIGKFDGLVAGDNGECRQDGDIISVWCGESDTFNIQHNNSIRTQKGEDYLTADELAYRIRQFIRKAPYWIEITPGSGSAPTTSNRRVPAPVIVMAGSGLRWLESHITTGRGPI